MKVLPLCEDSRSKPLKYNNKTSLPAASVNYTPLLWLFSETIKGNGAVSEVSGKEPSTVTDSLEKFLPKSAYVWVSRSH